MDVSPAAGTKGPSEATVLRGVIDDRYRLIRSTDGRIYGARLDEPARALEHGRADSPLVRSACRDFLSGQGKWPSTTAVAETSAYVVAMADDAPVEHVQVRCQWERDERAIWLDTCDDEATVLRIEAGKVIAGLAPPSPFRRSPFSAPIEWTDETGGPGDLAPLWRLVRVAEQDRPLVLALLICAWLTGTPQPIVLVTGPQDAGKTSAARYLLSFVDPVTNERGRSLPADEREWKSAVASSRVVLVDNVSGMTAAASDTLCRVATGGEASGRALYSDDGVHSTNLHVPVWMTSISTGVLRGDLASRMVRIELEALDEDTRISESDLRAAQDQARPQVTRGLLWLAAEVLARWDTTDRSRLGHRMGDFAVIVRIVDELLGTRGESRLGDDAADLAADVVDVSPVAQAVLRLADEGALLGKRQTMAELLAALNATRRDGWVIENASDRAWPRTPGMLSAALQRIEPALRRAHGVHVERGKSDGKRYVRISKTAALTEVAA